MNPESKPLNLDRDPRRWADELNAALTAQGRQPLDPDWLVGWFAKVLPCRLGADEIAELARVKGMIAAHNRFCAESCRSRYVYDNCAYRRKDGSFIYGAKRCSDCPEHWIIKDNR